jgi:hypothetical protein
VYLFLSAGLQGGAAPVSPVPLVIGLAGAALLTATATALPLWAGMRRVRALEV